MIGRTISHYRVLEEISRGGMGIVYRAVDDRLDREVALKVLPPDLVSDPERRQRFIQEAKAASKLEHPNIAVIHEIDEAEGITFIAMELIRGAKLGQLLERERLPLRRVLDIATETAEGLTRAHDKGIVHRDLKPANIMLTEDGHAKLIDFGLAKLMAPLAGEGSELETAFRKETDPGIVMGTVSYMSPEQARGLKIDHRSDIFTFGIVLHEMLTGQAPFRGATGIDTLQAILREPAPRLPAGGVDLAAEVSYELQRILDKCLAKDPSERYQSMRDLVIDLRAVRRRLESGATSSVAAVPGPVRAWRRSWAIAAAGVGAAALVVAGVFLSFSREPTDIPAERSSRPSIAVLYFENNTGDPSLDWLRTALTDMLVTDLSQSPQMEVVSTDRLYQILKELNRLDERVTSFELVRDVASRARVSTVLLGSFVKVGENIRISVRLQDAESGRILTTERVEGVGEESIFPMVDDLTRRVQANFALPQASVADVDADLEDLTTSSLEAYRYYAEAMNLHMQFKEQGAIPLLERAVEVDPGFAMALAKLSVIHGNLNHSAEREEYGKRALEHLDRLSPRERYYIEGMYYSNKLPELGRSIEAYRKAIELYPDHLSARHNLALIYDQLGRYDEAAELGEELLRRGMTYPATYGGMASHYGRRGEYERGRRILEQFIRGHPDNAEIQRIRREYLTDWGRLEEARQALQTAESLEPGHPAHLQARWELAVLDGDWQEAASAAEKLRASSEVFRKWQGAMGLGKLRLYQGRSREALGFVEDAVKMYAEPGPWKAIAHHDAAHLLLHRGEPERALEEARTAGRVAEGEWPEWWSLVPATLAQARLGRWDGAEKSAAEFERLIGSLDAPSWRLDGHRLAGELALVRGDAAGAVTALERAESLLTPRGWSSPTSVHVPVWFSLGEAYVQAGREEEALARFRRIVESGGARVHWPVPFVRSHYFLGKIHERRGEMDLAREHYRRFVDSWRDGDLDRERVIEALDKIT